MKIQFSDNGLHQQLAPLTLTRPVAEIRFGIFTIAESWQYLIEKPHQIFYKTEGYLTTKFPSSHKVDLLINGAIKPTKDLVNDVLNLKDNEALFTENHWIASKGNGEKKVISNAKYLAINFVWDIFQLNHAAISFDFEWYTKNKTSEKLNDTNSIHGKHEVFVESGAKANHVIFNTEEGPIFIGKDAEIMEGSIIRGPFALCNNAGVKMGAKIYTGTTIGPFCKVGGEVSNSIFFAYSNKGHDGFLGNSVIGEWCNLGADTNTSNLKNNYSNVSFYNYASQSMEKTPVLFLGTIMGDHAKTGINTMLNTATSVGVASNIFGGGFPPKFIPSFSWGGFENAEKFKLEKAFEVATNMMARRKIPLTEADKSILTHLFNLA